MHAQSEQTKITINSALRKNNRKLLQRIEYLQKQLGDALISLSAESRKTNAWHHGCKFEGWQCFHCGEVFETVGGARDHFGADPTKEPGCLIKVRLVDERGLQMELRKVEAERDSLQYQISNESTEADLKIQAMQSQHQIDLRREEEKGYARGLKDGLETPRKLEWREIGDGSWTDTTSDPAWFEYCKKSAMHDTRIVSLT